MREGVRKNSRRSPTSRPITPRPAPCWKYFSLLRSGMGDEVGMDDEVGMGDEVGMDDEVGMGDGVGIDDEVGMS